MRIAIARTLILACPLIGFSGAAADEPSGALPVEVATKMSVLTATKLVDGRLRLEPERWRKVAYPGALGAAYEKLVADEKSHGMTEDEARSVFDGDPEGSLSLYSAKKLLERIGRAYTGYAQHVGSGDDARMRFATGSCAAEFRAGPNPYPRVSFRQRAPDRRELTVDDNPKTMFRLVCRRSGRVGVIAQNRAGRVHVMFDNGETLSAGPWEQYRELVQDLAGLPKGMRADLGDCFVKLPDADSVSAIEDLPSNLRDGPLPRLRFQVSQLGRFQLADGIVRLDRSHWERLSNDAAAMQRFREANRDDEVSPFEAGPAGGDPFGSRSRPRQRWLRRASPAAILIEALGGLLKRKSWSASSGDGIRQSCVQNQELLVECVEEVDIGRIKMSFVERTRSARFVEIDETSEESMSLVYSDPDNSYLFVQDAIGQVRLAFCESMRAGKCSYRDYREFRSSSDAATKGFLSSLEAVGVVFPDSL